MDLVTEGQFVLLAWDTLMRIWGHAANQSEMVIAIVVWKQDGTDSQQPDLWDHSLKSVSWQ